MATYGFLRTFPPVWNYLNRTSSNLFKKHRPKLDSLQKEVVDDLLKNGVASVNLDEIFPDDNILSDLMLYIKNDKREGRAHPRKPYLKHYWAEPTSEIPQIDFDNPFVRLMIHHKFLDIVNSYMNSCSKLIYFDLAKTSQITLGDAPKASQRWHRDPGFKKQIKIFIYLNDVNDNTGPFKYVLGSHLSGKFRALFPQKQFGRHGFYPPQDLLEMQLSKNDVRSFTGRAGTVVFCDTIGLHKGGYTISGSRTMFTSMFVPSCDVIKPMFSHPINAKDKINSFNEVERFTVT